MWDAIGALAGVGSLIVSIIALNKVIVIERVVRHYERQVTTYVKPITMSTEVKFKKGEEKSE